MNYSLGRGLNVCKVIFAAMLLIITLVFPCAAAEANGQKVLRVAFPEAEGYTETAPDGSHYGLVVDFLNEIAKYTGWEYEYIAASNDSLLDDFFAGKFDLMGGTYYADGYEEYFAYPKYSCGYSKQVLLARKDDTRIKSYDLNTLNGKTIGVYERAAENIRRLQEFLVINDLDCTLKYYNYEESAVTGDLKHFLKNGDVDLLLGNSVDAGDEFYIAASFDSQPHYIVTAPDNSEILEGLNMALEKIYDTDPNFAKKIYAANFPETGSGHAALSSAELAYVKQNPSLTVAVPSDWHPMMCINNDEVHDGLVPDILNEISAFSGLEFNYLFCDNYADALHKVENGEADILGFFVGTEDDAIKLGLALTVPYVETNSILVRNKESSYPAEGLVGATMEGRLMPDDIVADEVRYYSDISEALSDVNSGKVDFFYGTSSNLENVIQKNNFTNLVQVTLINNNVGISFALTRPVHPELFTILNKAINNLTDEQKASISSRNIVSIGSSHMTLSGIVYANPTLAVSVVAVFLIMILIVVLLVSRSRLHAAAMRAELAKAEADSRAKSAFLSRMSHEIRTPMNAIVGLADLTAMMADLPEKARGNLAKIKKSSHYLLNLISDILDMSRIESGRMELADEPFSIHALLHEVEDMMSAEAANRGITFRLEKKFSNEVLVGDAIRLRQVLLNLLSNAFKFTQAGGTVLARVTEDSSNDQEAVFTFRISDTGIGIPAEDQARIFHSFEQVGPNITKSQGTGLGLAISTSIVQLMGGELKLHSESGKGSEFYFTVTLPKGQFSEQAKDELTTDSRERFQNVSILIAEDNELNAEIAIELLSVQGAKVTWAENGKAALEQFEQNTPGTFQVILMDILMPEMNGLETARAIRALPRPDAAVIPIIAMTANTFKEDAEAALEAGMTGFIPKPIDVAHLYKELQNALLKTQ